MKKELKGAVQNGLTLGIFWGAVFFLSTWCHIITGYPGMGFLYFFKDIYLGYTISPLGSLIGLVWAFVDGLLVGYIFTRLRTLIGMKLD